MTLPASLDEAVAALTAMPAAVPVAGGTDLMAAVNSGLLRPAALVGLGRISEIRGWQYQDGHALLGAGLTHARMGRPDFAALIPALAAAARAAGPPQIRNAGTLGGNIATAAPTGDALPVLAALEATLIIAGPGGARREIPVRTCWPAVEMLRAGELIGFVRVPLLHAPQVFLKATGRTGPGRAIASVALVLDPARRGVRCAVGRHRADAAAPPGGRAVGRPAHRLGRQPRDRPEALTAFGEYVAAACIPDPAPAEDGSEPASLRPPYCTCGARSPRWPDEHWGGRCRDRRPTHPDRAARRSRRLAAAAAGRRVRRRRRRLREAPGGVRHGVYGGGSPRPAPRAPSRSPRPATATSRRPSARTTPRRRLRTGYRPGGHGPVDRCPSRTTRPVTPTRAGYPAQTEHARPPRPVHGLPRRRPRGGPVVARRPGGLARRGQPRRRVAPDLVGPRGGGDGPEESGEYLLGDDGLTGYTGRTGDHPGHPGHWAAIRALGPSRTSGFASPGAPPATRAGTRAPVRTTAPGARRTTARPPGPGTGTSAPG